MSGDIINIVKLVLDYPVLGLITA